MPECPKCRAGLETTDLDGLPAQDCPDCGALWLAREFVTIWADSRRGNTGHKPDGFDLKRLPGTTVDMRCPDCDLEMVRLKSHGLQFEHCTTCQGVVFDRGELEALARAMTTDPNAGPRASTPKHDPDAATVAVDPSVRHKPSRQSPHSTIGFGLLDLLEFFFDY